MTSHDPDQNTPHSENDHARHDPSQSSSDQDDRDATRGVDHPTGEAQAAENADNEPAG